LRHGVMIEIIRSDNLWALLLQFLSIFTNVMISTKLEKTQTVGA
jgi:hypothetical protein